MFRKKENKKLYTQNKKELENKYYNYSFTKNEYFGNILFILVLWYK